MREQSKHLGCMTDMHNNKQDDDGVHNLLKFVEQRPEHNETTHPKNY